MKLFWFTGWMCLILIWSGIALGQDRVIQGQIMDDQKGEPIAFAAIQIKNTYIGTISDVDGKFKLRILNSFLNNKIIISCLGYKRDTITLASNQSFLTIKLAPEPFALKEFTYKAGENPAHAIIRKAVKNRGLNDPNGINQVEFNSYNKTVITLLGLEETYSDSALNDVFQGGHLSLMESYSQVKKMRPDFYQEKILDSRITGLDKPEFAMLSSSFQPFSFYDDPIFLFDLGFINPLTNNFLSHYDYYLEDSVVHEADVTYIISFEGKKSRQHRTLRGVLSINSNDFAIENVEAYPADSTLKINFRVQQLYKKIGDTWFPNQLYTRYFIKDNTIEGLPVLVKNQSYFSNINFETSLVKRDFGNTNVFFERASNPDWASWRPDSLAWREVRTLENYDTLSPRAKRVLNGMAFIGVNLVDGKLPIGKISLVPRHLLGFNQYEGFRLGMGLSTNDRISKYFSIGGYGAYGFKDRALKYGAHLEIRPKQDQASVLTLSYSQDVSEPAMPELLHPSGLLGDPYRNVFRNFAVFRMDSIQRFSLEYKFVPSRNWMVGLFANREAYFPTYSYSFQREQDPALNSFINSEFGINLRYAFRERTTRVTSFRTISQPGNPVLQLRVSKSIPDVLSGDLNLVSTSFRYRQNIYTPLLGFTLVTINAGKVWGSELPYPFLFNGYSAKSEGNNFSFYFPGYLQTMGLYEFLSDEYAHLSIEQNLGLLFTAVRGYMKPELLVVQNSSIGNLGNPERHEGILFNTMEKGFHESGLVLKNLIRINSDLYWTGLSIGLFYRYGPYRFDATGDNFQFTFHTSISF